MIHVRYVRNGEYRTLVFMVLGRIMAVTVHFQGRP